MSFHASFFFFFLAVVFLHSLKIFSLLNLRFPRNGMDFHGFDIPFVLVVDLELKSKLEVPQT